ncbi:hypothetical protein ACQB6R_05075 [Propionibacteriaceae bacterium G1746]|uniref:sunset domain-containing protein n=1 Tax=Aestuariimicrobium sp. G57 TaxID=3418485 RepID=UPI003C24BB44
MSRKNKHLQHAADETQTAADKGAAAVEHAAAAVTAAVAALSDYLTQAQDKVAPAARTAIGKTLDAAGTARTQLEPHLADAYAAVAPTLDQAKHKVNEDLVPRLAELRHAAGSKVSEDLLPRIAELRQTAEQDARVQDAIGRGTAAWAALKGEAATVEAATAELEPVKKKSLGATIAKVAAVGALLAGAAVAVRQFLLSKDDGWTAHEPSPAYTPTPRADNEVVFTTTTPASPAAGAEDVTEEVPVPSTHTHSADVHSEGDPVADMVEEGGPVASEAADLDEQAATAATPLYGDGAYVGAEPPEGFVIKGNERSKKYHVPTSGGYERTIADVWFNSEEAAQAAGFSKAQR